MKKRPRVAHFIKKSFRSPTLASFSLFLLILQRLVIEITAKAKYTKLSMHNFCFSCGAAFWAFYFSNGPSRPLFRFFKTILQKKTVGSSMHNFCFSCRAAFWAFYFSNGPSPPLFRFFSKQFYRKKTVGSSMIQTWIFRVEGEHAHHLTTTTAAPELCFMRSALLSVLRYASEDLSL